MNVCMHVNMSVCMNVWCLTPTPSATHMYAWSCTRSEKCASSQTSKSSLSSSAPYSLRLMATPPSLRLKGCGRQKDPISRSRVVSSRCLSARASTSSLILVPSGSPLRPAKKDCE